MRAASVHAVTTIHLARHGETDWNRELRWQGHADPPLNALGRQQARALAESLAGTRISAVYSSDLRRASETAEIVAGKLEVPLRLDAALRELDVGSWQGQTLAELEARHAGAVARWEESGEHGWEGGESHTEMAARVLEAIGSIAAEHAGEEVLVVSHGGPMRALKAFAAGLDYPGDRRSVPYTHNCEVCAIAVEDGTIRGLD
jgi:2,3-bisphosphoglycerate-dependent phosphoglycerate mutase